MNEARRGARTHEDLRLRTEKHVSAGGKRPRVVFAEVGDLKMRMARSTFASNFFACGGFEIETRQFEWPAEIAAADGDLIVLCSSDAGYAELVAKLMPAMKELGRSTPVIVAGNPENADELAAAGIADFVHVRSNPVEMLTEWQERLGVKG